MQNKLKKLSEEATILVSVKLLIIEWLLELLRAISIYFLNKRARIEADRYSENNEYIDMRTAPVAIKHGIVHDETVLNSRWDLCQSCEFLTESNRCTKCGCFMKVKHKLAIASCPVGKWGKYKIGNLNGIRTTS